jgi:hypothetical protein
MSPMLVAALSIFMSVGLPLIAFCVVMLVEHEHNLVAEREFGHWDHDLPKALAKLEAIPA